MRFVGAERRFGHSWVFCISGDCERQTCTEIMGGEGDVPVFPAKMEYVRWRCRRGRMGSRSWYLSILSLIPRRGAHGDGQSTFNDGGDNHLTGVSCYTRCLRVGATWRAHQGP